MMASLILGVPPEGGAWGKLSAKFTKMSLIKLSMSKVKCWTNFCFLKLISSNFLFKVVKSNPPAFSASWCLSSLYQFLSRVCSICSGLSPSFDKISLNFSSSSNFNSTPLTVLIPFTVSLIIELVFKKIFFDAYYLAYWSVKSPLHSSLKAADVELLADSTKNFFIFSWIARGNLLSFKSSIPFSEIPKEKLNSCYKTWSRGSK